MSDASLDQRETAGGDADERLRSLVAWVLQAPGTLDPALRRQALELAPLPGPAGEYVRKLERGGSPTADDVGALRDAGYSEDQVFELTVSAALGAAKRRMDAGLRALDEAETW